MTRNEPVSFSPRSTQSAKKHPLVMNRGGRYENKLFFKVEKQTLATQQVNACLLARTPSDLLTAIINISVSLRFGVSTASCNRGTWSEGKGMDRP